MLTRWESIILWISFTTEATKFTKFAKDFEGQLYEDLLFDYNKIPRPVKNSSDILTVDVGASLIRIIDVVRKFLEISFCNTVQLSVGFITGREKSSAYNEFMTEVTPPLQKWFDSKLTWDPLKYGGLRTLHIPSDFIWTPDLVLYNK
ncbi:hypothetical protein COOONC_00240 [Cooperia oncophora]